MQYERYEELVELVTVVGPADDKKRSYKYKSFQISSDTHSPPVTSSASITTQSSTSSSPHDPSRSTRRSPRTSRSKLKFKLKNHRKIRRLNLQPNLPRSRRRPGARLWLGRLPLSPRRASPLRRVQRGRRQNKQSQHRPPLRKSSRRSSRKRRRPSSGWSRRKWNP